LNAIKVKETHGFLMILPFTRVAYSLLMILPFTRVAYSLLLIPSFKEGS
jgi:hypothetical protein